ncbi:MAG: alpha-L-fucosidase, partial [Opitutaceae bacterium]
RAPGELTDYGWQVDEPVLYRFGYTENNPTPIAKAGGIITSLINNVSRNGALLLNISPRADGTIPDEQEKLLLEIGAWLKVNGEAIYGTRPWTKFGEGALTLDRGQSYSAKDIRFTTNGDVLYAIVPDWPADGRVVVTSLAAGSRSLPAGKIQKVEVLGHRGTLEFSQDAEGLKVKFPTEKPCDHAFALKISGLTLR